jgi:hypothetical protein
MAASDKAVGLQYLWSAPSNPTAIGRCFKSRTGQYLSKQENRSAGTCLANAEPCVVDPSAVVWWAQLHQNGTVYLDELDPIPSSLRYLGYV